MTCRKTLWLVSVIDVPRDVTEVVGVGGLLMAA